MAQPIYANNVAGTMGANIGPSDTAILLGAGQGVFFPALTAGNWYYATLVHQATAVIEIVKVTGRTVDTLTVVRGQDGTSATSFTIGSLVELRLTAQTLREVDWHVVAGVANGLATLDASALIPIAQIPATVARTADVVPLSQKGAANGVATLDAGSKVPVAQVPTLPYIPNTGGSATGTIISGTASGELRVGGQGAGQVGTLFTFDGKMASTAAGAPGGLATIWNTANFDPGSKANQTNPYINGDCRVTSNFRSDGGFFISQGGSAVLAAQAGPIYLRPNGEGSTANQGIYNTSGLFQAVDVQSYSDRRFKRNIRKAVARNLASLVPFKQWEMKSTGKRGVGNVAQDVLKHFPEYTGRDPQGYLSVDKAGIALEQSYSNEARITALEKLVARLLKKG